MSDRHHTKSHHKDFCITMHVLPNVPYLPGRSLKLSVANSEKCIRVAWWPPSAAQGKLVGWGFFVHTRSFHSWAHCFRSFHFSFSSFQQNFCFLKDSVEKLHWLITSPVVMICNINQSVIIGNQVMFVDDINLKSVKLIILYITKPVF